jgi:SSS family solute:Na+ symporter
MNTLDWLVLLLTLVLIAAYGIVKTRKTSAEGFLKGDNSFKWWMMGLSIMATQASAITFLSTPGQAMEDGMRFLQFYFGLPIAMVIISATMVPIYYRLKVYTAYEYLESRFDVKTRLLAASLFLILRGLSAGITIFAPALLLSTILELPIALTTIFTGTLVMIYVVSGGAQAVSITQRHQMAVMMGGMILAGVLAFYLLPENVSFGDTVQIAGEMGKFNLVSLEFDITQRYNIWSGLIAGTFLFLSYFGTDQSQVGRYLGGKSVTESRLSLMFNGLLKIPMQFVILFIGVLVYVFYLFSQPPAYHNHVLLNRAMGTEMADSIRFYEEQFNSVYAEKRSSVDALVTAIKSDDPTAIKEASARVKAYEETERGLREQIKASIAKAIPAAKTKDNDYMFLNFVLNNLPHGIIGLLVAVMFAAAMSSLSGELNALATTTAIDIYKRNFRPEASDKHYLRASRLFTLGWAILAMTFAMLASFSENLIEFVNIIGSLFYGTILGIFLTAFYLRRVGGSAVFLAALVAEAVVLYCYFRTDIAYLLYNIIGCICVMVLSLVFSLLRKSN